MKTRGITTKKLSIEYKTVTNPNLRFAGNWFPPSFTETALEV